MLSEQREMFINAVAYKQHCTVSALIQDFEEIEKPSTI